MNAERLLAHYERIADTPDAVSRLRHFILDLALRGKLVPQVASDEVASEQLRRIAFAKARIGRTNRARTLDEGKRDNPAIEAALPKGWAIAPLSDIVAILNGRAYKQAELLDRGTPVLRVGNLFTSDKWYFSDLQLQEDKYCDNGDLIFAWSASFGPFIWAGGKVIYHYHIWKLPLHSEPDFSKRYLYTFLLHRTRQIKDSGHGVSMIHMTKEKMQEIDVPVPPLAEQHRIVAKVDELMALCDQLEATRAEREAMRDRLAAASFARLNVPDPATFQTDALFALGVLPALTTRPDQIKLLRQTILNLAVRGYLSTGVAGQSTRTKIGDVASLQNGYAFKSEWFSKTGTRLLRNTNVGHGVLNWNQEVCLPEATIHEYERFQLHEGDIVLSLDRPFIATGTKVARVKATDLPALLLQRVGRFATSHALHPDYLYLWITSPHFAEQIDPGRSNGVPHISSKQVEAAELFLPPLAEQLRLVTKVDELMSLCDRIETTLSTGGNTRLRLLDALLHEALMPVESQMRAQPATVACPRRYAG